MAPRMIPSTREAYKLLHDGAITLSQIEANGIRIDTNHLANAEKELEQKIKEVMHRVKEDPIFHVWKNRFGRETNLGSRPQLAWVFFEKLGYKSTIRTKTDKASTTDLAFENINIPFVKDYFLLEKLKKARNSFVKNIKEEVVDGILRPFLELHKAVTFRGSSEKPNFQNMPIRSKYFGRLIRKCIIPRDGRALVEVDYGALEFRIAASFWKDPEMVSYASDDSKDIHRDMAAKCYSCDKKLVGKELRYNAKNKFVFPILYGSYYVKCAINLWEAIDKINLKLEDGTPVKKHLASQGITSLGACDSKLNPKKGTFEHHIRESEEYFNSTFPVFSSSKEKWWRDYKRVGSFPLMTGFTLTWAKEGLCSKNNALNSPIQGPGFHCLLWSIIQLQKWLKRNKLKSLIISQIHDCVLLDVLYSELQDVLDACKRIMSQDIRDHWDWILTPLIVEVDVTPEGESWYEKAPWFHDGSKWIPKSKKQ